jgi:endonuclease I
MVEAAGNAQNCLNRLVKHSEMREKSRIFELDTLIMKRFYSLLFSVLLALDIYAQPPAGYYNSAAGLSGTPLKLALHNIIDNHTVVTYASLWTHFQTTDKKANGKVWDIYSDNPGGTPPYEYTFVTDQCGNYSVEGDCYNREHSWPQSWFNQLAGPVSDLFHIYPTDGKVNGLRSNYAFGEVTSGTTTLNGGKLGSNTFPGFSGIAFEPIDEYKGDLARSFFYMSTRYYTEDSGWSTSDMTNRSELLPWAVNLLMSWHVQDTVSTKEINRNNAIYGIQNNRNPYIDHPEYAALVWSSTTGNGTEAFFKDVINIYPNPSNGNFNLDLYSSKAQSMDVKMFDYSGKLIYNHIFNTTGSNTHTEFNLEGYSQGAYHLQVVAGSKVFNTKVVLTR